MNNKLRHFAWDIAQRKAKEHTLKIPENIAKVVITHRGHCPANFHTQSMVEEISLGMSQPQQIPTHSYLE